MTQSEIIRKLSMECCVAIGEFDHYKTIRTYIQMALAVGIEHTVKELEEIVVMDMNGVEAGRYKSLEMCSKELGIERYRIKQVLEGKIQSAGGLRFLMVKDFEMFSRVPTSDEAISIVPLT